MSESRFEELMGRLIDDDISAEEIAELIELTRDDPDRQSELRAQLETTDVLAQSADELRGGSLFVAAVRSRLTDDPFVDGVHSILSAGGSRSPVRRVVVGRIGWVMTLAAAAIALVATALLFVPRGDRQIARITGLSGSLQWTGDGGRVVRDLPVGTGLTGGILEGLAPDAWAELAFPDGTTVTLSGTSMLTFSEHGRKELHLREGSISASVSPQPDGRPMLVHTRTATLEVVGTAFEVTAGLASTTLNVSEGSVRLRRLNDGRTVDVPAHHRAIASADLALEALPVPASVDRWSSRLDLGPDATFGKWSATRDEAPAQLRAIPYLHTFQDGRTIMLYVVGVGVTYGDVPPVVPEEGSRLRVRGRLGASHPVWFGMTMKRPNGEFAGKFQVVEPATGFEGGREFEVLLGLDAFELDPSLAADSDKLPASPVGLVVESLWCHTLTEPAGLEITEIELVPAEPPAR